MNNVIQFQVENTEQKYHSILSLSDQAQICAVSFSYELFRSSFLDASNGLVWALWPTGRVQQPQHWVFPSLSDRKYTVVLLSLSSSAQTMNLCCQMRECLHSQALGTMGSGIIGLKT